MNKLQRINKIKECLKQLDPIKIQIIDESSQHIGHAGAKDGRGHYAMKIISSQFYDKTLVQRHQMVYQALDKLMQTEIHALKIKALTPHENKDATLPTSTQLNQFTEVSPLD